MRVIAISTFYRTKALGPSESPPFYNGVVEVETELAPRVLREIEARLGRARSGDRYAPRTIDLDIVVQGDAVVDEPDLIVPDPDLLTRAFVAIPLLELAPDMVIPGSGERLVDAAAGLDVSEMAPLHDFTGTIRREISA